ncbi:MAG: HNH endonuclease, partial [Gemmatimonadetes bacterium]|nr:HNH endonuclease [Gemmatimonadota bacterium]
MFTEYSSRGATSPGTTSLDADTLGTDPLDADPLGDEIAALCAHINAATYRLLTLLRVYDEEERWQGCRSCAHWLSWR